MHDELSGFPGTIILMSVPAVASFTFNNGILPNYNLEYIIRHEKSQNIPACRNWTLKNSRKRAGL